MSIIAGDSGPGSAICFATTMKGSALSAATAGNVMSESNPSSEQVSIEALTAAVAHVLLYRSADLSVQLHNALGFTAAERDAWMTAFKWRDKFGPISRLNDEELAEFNKGIQLIRNLQ